MTASHLGTTATEVDDDAVRGARRFYWLWLTFATSWSVLGNIAHALLVAPEAVRLLAAVASIVPSAFVLGSTHAVALGVTMRRFTLVHLLGLVMTTIVSACAFFLSFDALRALAMMLGWRSGTAWLFPVAIDVSIAQATFGLLSLRRIAVHDGRSQRSSLSSEVGVTTAVVPPARTASNSGPSSNDVEPPDGTTDDTDPARWKPTADDLVRYGMTSKDPEIVAAILAEHAAGVGPSAIGRRHGLHHSTVGRIVAGAADLSR